MVNTLDKPLFRVIALNRGRSDRSEFGATGRAGYGVRIRGRADALVPGGCTVDAHGEVVVGLARFEGTSIIIRGHVPVTAHLIVNMLAVFPGVRTSAGTHAELGSAYEVGPLVVLNLSTEGVTEDKSTDGVTVAIGTVRVKLSSFITSLDVDLGEVTYAGYLNVVLGTNEVNTLEGAIGDHTSTTAALGTPSDFVPLRVADCADRGGCPETEIIRVVHPHCLAHGRLRGCSTAVVGSCLTALGLVRELIVEVASIPNLVVVIFVVIAVPYLNGVAVGHRSAGQVDALAAVPSYMVVPIICIVELLVIIFGTIPDLKFITIGSRTTWDIQAFGTVVERNSTVGTELPLLVRAASAVGDLDRSTVRVICTETLFGVGAGLNEEVSGERGISVRLNGCSAKEDG